MIQVIFGEITAYGMSKERRVWIRKLQALQKCASRDENEILIDLLKFGHSRQDRYLKAKAKARITQ